MAVTAAFLDTCRGLIAATPELTAFRAAYATYNSAARADKARYWNACFSDAQAGMSPAYRLRKVIRDTVSAQGVASLTALEVQDAYRTLVGEYVQKPERPMTAPEEEAALQSLLLREQLS